MKKKLKYGALGAAGVLMAALIGLVWLLSEEASEAESYDDQYDYHPMLQQREAARALEARTASGATAPHRPRPVSFGRHDQRYAS